MTSYQPARGKPGGGGHRTPMILLAVAVVLLAAVVAIVAIRSKDDGSDSSSPTTLPASTTSSVAEGAVSTIAPGVAQGSTSSTAPVTTQAPNEVPGGTDARGEAAARLIQSLPAPKPVPAGDYTRLCTEINDQIAGVTLPKDLLEFIDLLGRLDLPRLAIFAPAGVRDSFTDLVDSFPAARKVVEQADGVPAPEDLPAPFLPAVGTVINTLFTKCAPQ